MADALGFHYQLMKNIFTAARSHPIKILDMRNTLPKHPKKKWKKVPLKDKSVIVNHQIACWGKAHAIGNNAIEHKDWPGFPYHYFISFDGGHIMQCVSLDDMSYHASGANYEGIGIALQGRLYAHKCDGIDILYTFSDMDDDEVRGKIEHPSRKQMVSLIRLWDYLLHLDTVPNLTIGEIHGHCKFSPRNRVCDPGDGVMALLAVYKYEAQLRGKSGLTVNQP